MFALFNLVLYTAVAALSLPRAPLSLGDLLNTRDNCIHSDDTCCNCCKLSEVVELPIKLMISFKEINIPSIIRVQQSHSSVTG